MKFMLELELGNVGMQYTNEVAEALHTVYSHLSALEVLRTFDELDPFDRSGSIRDTNGSTVGKWQAIRTLKPDNTAEILDALSSYASGKTIDITPRGCTTPEGAARVSKALEEWNGSAHEVANLAATVIESYGTVIKAAMVAYDPDSHEEYGDLERAIETRAAKQEEFLRAVAGVQNPD